MVFQSYALYPHKTVRQNMGFALRLRRTDKAEVAARVERAAAILGLGPYLERYPRQLSGGQRQRVAMGRAIVRDPQVFLFDEPLSNLDAKLRVQMRAEIKELHQRLRTTTVFVTHDQIEAMTMADKIVVMNAGRIEQVGAPLELYDRPTNLFVAEFIGSPAMNLLRGVVRGGGVAVQERVLPVAARGLAEGRAVVYGIRPEHLELHEDGIAARVGVVEPTGAETLAYLRFGEQELVAEFRDRHDLVPGQEVRIRPRADRAHIFDPETGARNLMNERVVLAYGDSNTHGTAPMATLEDNGRHRPAERWPGVLAAELGAGWRVVEEGLPGRTTVYPDPVSGVHKNGLALLPAALESHRPIDAVVLMLGTNDLKLRFQVPVVEIGESVSALLHLIRHSYMGPDGTQPRMLLVAPPPVLEVGCLAEIFEGGAAKSLKLAPAYAAVAARHGAAFLDAGRVIASSPLDGVHFDAGEHGKLGRAVAVSLVAMFA